MISRSPEKLTTAQFNLPLILASTSPRRQQLLALANLEFDIMRVDIDEAIRANETPQDYILRMVSNKAKAACDDLQHLQHIDNHTTNLKLIITADTIGVLTDTQLQNVQLPDNQSILVKPQDKADAIQMWSKMSGSCHHIWTAVQLSLVNHSGLILDTKTILEKTEVEFITLSQKQMQDYWDSGEPQDKAGGYGIQGRGAAWVKRINGSYTNVVGLPLAQTLIAIDDMRKTVIHAF